MDPPKTKVSTGGDSQSRNGGGDANVMNLLLARMEAMSQDIKLIKEVKEDTARIKEENKQIIAKVDLCEKNLKQALQSVEKDLVKTKKEILKLKKENTLLNRENISLKKEVNSLKQITQYNAVKIVNFPVRENENLNTIFKQICDHISFNCSNDLFECYRLRMKNPHSTPPIVIKFLKNKDKTEFLKLIKDKKYFLPTSTFISCTPDSKIYISEFMSPTYAALYKKARIMKNNNYIQFVWFKNNQLFIKVSPDSQPITICNEDDLNNILMQIDFPSTDLRTNTPDIPDMSDQDGHDTDVSDISRTSSKKRKLKLISAGSTKIDSFFRPSSAGQPSA